jgi:hypothetical protein
MKDMNDLHVESYDAKEVETKKQSLVKRAAAAGGAIVLSLSLFNFIDCFPIVMGGAGAWFHSCPVDECKCIECECIECECTDDESAEVE